MRNNSMLILIVAVIGFGILCAILASIAFAYYNSDLSSLTSSQPDILNGSENARNLLDEESSNNSILDAFGSSLDSVSSDFIYLTDLMQNFQTCQTDMMMFQANIANLEIDQQLLDDKDYVETLSNDLERIDENCSDLGSKDDVPEAFEELNSELLKSDKYVSTFTENYLDFLKYKQTKYLDDGNEAFLNAADHLQTALQILEKAYSELMP
ncbi:MAG: hypothetical protein JEZ00_06660 [Anaerolineaceae bacterium]|nr:hypothetical protein [Anaerolineaceae bacterium]